MNKSINKLAIENFKNICRNEFGYLLTDFGFREVAMPPGEFENEFKIRFVRQDLAVIVEGIHYGTAVMVYLQDGKGRQIPPMLLKPDFRPNYGKTPKGKMTTQAEEIKVNAQLLVQYGIDLLKGDFSAFERAIEKRTTAWSEYEAHSKFGVAEQDAVAAYKNQDWSKVVKSLEPYEDKISPRMAKKLKEARENLLLKDKDKK